MEDLRHWLALLHAPDIGPVGYQRLLESCGDPEALFSGAVPVQGEPLRNYLRAPNWSAVEKDLAWAEGADRYILTLNDRHYPELLRLTSNPPLVLFVHGDPAILATPQLAMVGSRNPTPVGMETAQDFAHQLGKAGMTITSGLALGIDAASHQGCLDAAGQTVAVLGTGPDRVYPARHRELAHDIVNNGGALVSEFSPGTPPLPGNFPRRNRIISGLSLGTLVVEAAMHSGSLITARTATEQGREVFSIPGSIHSPLAKGCNHLIRQGAKLVEIATDILEELMPQLQAALVSDDVISAVPAAAKVEQDEDYERLLTCLEHVPTPVDALVERSGLTAEEVSSMLLVLELQGDVVSAPGGRYSRTSKRA